MFLLTCALCQCVYASSDCDQKKNTLYHNFLGNLNFKNIIIFFKRTCCTLITPSKTILRATSEPFDIFSTKISSFAEFTFYMVIHSLEPSPPLFLKGGSKFWLSPPEGGSAKLKKRGLKYGPGVCVVWQFSYFIFSRFIIFTFRNYFTLSKTVSCIWEKNFFFLSS